MTSQFLTAAATIGLLGAGIAGSADTRSFQAMTPQASFAVEGDGVSGNMCRIDVVRTGAAGTAEISRRVLGDGSCVCVVTTGAAGTNGAAEEVVANLRRDQKCDGASVSNAEPAEAGGGAGIFGLVALLGAGTGAVAGSSQSPGG